MKTKTKNLKNLVTQSLNHLFTCKRPAFTLAEVLITLGVIGVVAAVTLPTLLTNIQDRVRQEQVRTVKYKFTKATEKMNSLGLIGQYGTPSENDSTEKFVEELKKHMNIAKVCNSTKLNECWATQTITAYSGSSTTPQQVNVNTITNGTQLKALALGTAQTRTVGIVTGDGVPMILVYSPECSGFDESKQYTWSVENGKPVTNATTNCVSAIFDINGAKGPNKIGTDVRTLNSIFGAVNLEPDIDYEAADIAICNQMKKKYGVQNCEIYATSKKDYWVGAMYACDKLGLHLPAMSTLSNIANANYGTTQIEPYTVYLGPTFKTDNGGDCIEWLKTSEEYGPNHHWFTDADSIICASSTNIGVGSPLWDFFKGCYWSSSWYQNYLAYTRTIGTNASMWNKYARDNYWIRALCVGD